MVDNIIPTSKGNKIEEIFKNMDYGSNTESTDEAIQWLKHKENKIFTYIDKPNETPNGEVFSIKNALDNELLCNIYTPDEATIDKLLTKLGEAKNQWFEKPSEERTEIIYKFGNEIKKNETLLTQLEIVTRGLFGKDTRNHGLPLLTDYLQYYSSFSVVHKAENPSWKPEGLCVAIISEQNCLSSIGVILGPSLAAGYKIVLHAGPKLSVLLTFITELSVTAGVPEGTIKIIPGNIDLSLYFTHSKVSVVSILDDLHKEKYFLGNHFCKKILNFSSPGIPMLIFENSDLDSACQCAVNAAWTYQGMLPWSVRNVLVQENIFDNFVQKLKHKVSQLKIGSGATKNVDFSPPLNPEKLQEVIENAKSGGVEVFQGKINGNNFAPTLFIGGNIFTNNVIKEDTNNLPILSISAFRTINEAAALANNSRQGFGASIWTESTSLAHEIARKLKFGNIWVNSHGLFAANISVSPYKSSGNGYYGGPEGFDEYVTVKNLKTATENTSTSGDNLEKIISEAKKAREGWNKLSRLDRGRNLQTIANALIKEKKDFSSVNEKWIDDWVVSINFSVTSNNVSGVNSVNDYNVVTFKEPCGVIATETLQDIEGHNKKLIIAALLEGNSVIILNEATSVSGFYAFFASKLPKGLCSIVANTQGNIKLAALHKELNVYFGEKLSDSFRNLPLKTSAKFKTVNDNWNEVVNKVTLAKNVWFNAGQSFL